MARMNAITLAGFETKFDDDPDPWQTFANRDEARKRQAILHAMGLGPWGRVLEIAAGNGSNSAAIVTRSLRLDATEATASGTALVRKAIASNRPRARAIQLAVPARRLPRTLYDIAVVAELIYYLTPGELERTASEVARALRPGGMMVLAHHTIDFHDFVQHARLLHRDFLAATRCSWQIRVAARTGRWVVLGCRKKTTAARLVDVPTLGRGSATAHKP